MGFEESSYVDKEKNISSEYAKKVADRFAAKQNLKDIIAAQNFPTKDALNWQTEADPYEISTKDSKGILQILKDNLSGSKLSDQNYMRISYSHLFNFVKKLNTGSSKIFDVNVIEPGDKIYVNEGYVYVSRKTDSKYASFSAPIYPWSAPVPSKAPVDEPSSVSKEPVADPTPERPAPASPETIASELDDLAQNWNTDHPNAAVKSMIVGHDYRNRFSTRDSIPMYFAPDSPVEYLLSKAKEAGVSIENYNFIITPFSGWEGGDYLYEQGGQKYIALNLNETLATAVEGIQKAVQISESMVLGANPKQIEYINEILKKEGVKWTVRNSTDPVGIYLKHEKGGERFISYNSQTKGWTGVNSDLDNPLSAVKEIIDYTYYTGALKRIKETLSKEMYDGETPFYKEGNGILFSKNWEFKDDIVWKNTFGTRDIDKVLAEFNTVYYKETGALIEGKKTWTDDGISEGTFDKETRFLSEGKRTWSTGESYEGTFDKNENLIEGKITETDGSIFEGTFDKETGALIEGKKTRPWGMIEEGTFDKKTRNLIEGKLTEPDGTIKEGTFEQGTLQLIEGKATWPDGTVRNYKNGELIEAGDAK